MIDRNKEESILTDHSWAWACEIILLDEDWDFICSIEITDKKEMTLFKDMISHLPNDKINVFKRSLGFILHEANKSLLHDNLRVLSLDR